MTVRELITTWGFDIDDKPLRELDEHIKGVKETVMHLGELILGEGASLFGLAESTADAGVGFKRTAEEVGTTTQRLQELNYAAKQWDMAPEAVQQGLRHLSRMAVEAAQGSTEAIRSLSMAGVTSFRDSNGQMLRSDQLLEQVARHFKGMANDSMKAGLSMQVFGRGGTELMPLLNRMGPEFEAMAKQGRDLGYVMGDQAIEASEKFKESTNLVRAMVMGLRNTIGVALMPAIEGMVNDVIKWYQANRQVINSQIVEFAHQLADAVRGAFQMVTLIANGVMVLSSALGGLGNVLKIITALFVGWTALNIVVLLGSAAKAVRELAAAFTEMGISEAFATGGLSLILGGAAALAAGGLMYHAMNSGSTAGSPEGSAPVNFTGPGHGGSVSIRQEHTWNIHMPPGTTQEQADRLGREMDQRTAASMRGLAFAASSPVAR